MIHHYFQCPYCWQEISVVLDPSVQEQKYVEDCEVCCNPLEFHLSFDHGNLQSFQVSKLGQ